MAEQKARQLKPIEQCPDGHYYNSAKTGVKCGICGKELDPPDPEELTPEELEELTYLEEKRWVCGWLVCVKGANKGHAYTIQDGKNFIGSGSGMDIQIIGDKRIQKRNHAVVLFDAKSRKTLLMTGDSHGLVFLENQLVFDPVELTDFNNIELGESQFCYVPFCGANFAWDDAQEN